MTAFTLKAIRETAESANVEKYRIGYLIRETMRKINDAEDTIEREVDRIKRRSDDILNEVKNGQRVRYGVDGSDLDKAVQKRQDAYDLLVELIGPEAVSKLAAEK